MKLLRTAAKLESEMPMRNPRMLLLFLVFSLVVVGCAGEKIQYLVDYTAPTGFLLGPEDVVTVTVWRNQDLSKDVVVRPDGMISLPLIGDILAAGSTADELAKQITERLKEFMASPTVSVQVKEINSYFVFVTGEVAKPGKFPLKSYATVIQGISLAGGFTPFASRDKVHVIRITKNGKGENTQFNIQVDYSALAKGKTSTGNFFLRSGDVIVVP